MLKHFIPGSVLALICVAPLLAQTPAGVPTDTSAKAADAPTSGHAPDDVMKRLSDLVHAGKYGEAQQLTTGLLLAYPDDQRLIKAKALLDKSLAAASPNTSPDSIPQALPADTTAVQLTGMDKVGYNALILVARQAQQNADLEQQKASLKQFMDQSGPFLEKHPDQMLLWQLRAASAISLNDPMAGYEAGQKLLAAGAADSDNTSLQSLLAQLKSKGWLDEQEARKQEKLAPFGTWTLTINFDAETKEHEHNISQLGEDNGNYGQSFGPATIEVSRSDAAIKVENVSNTNEKVYPFLRATVANSGEIRWEGWTYLGWQPARSYEILDNNRTLRIVFSVVPTHTKTRTQPFANTDLSYTYTFILHKN